MLFWVFVYEPADGLEAASVAVHGVNFVVMLADLLLVRNPLYLSHVLVPMAYSIAYLLFSVLFYAVSGDNIYSALDWSDPAGASRLCALILFLMVPILWIPVYCIFLGRRCYRVSTSSGQVQDSGMQMTRGRCPNHKDEWVGRLQGLPVRHQLKFSHR